jgi:protoporphyrin/coproporphyrin ferrochelatase
MTGYLGTPDYRHGSPPRLGVLLVNLGTPDEPTTPAVRRYLAEFLWDPRIIEAPRILWWLILHGVILRTRPKRSAHAYQQVWTPQGSPLLVESRALADGLSGRLAARCGERARVELAMTYGNPSIPDALERMRRANVQRLLVLPMYPQYSATTTASIFERVTAGLSHWRWLPELRMVNQYWEEDAYIAAVADRIDSHWAQHGASTCCSRSTPSRSATSSPAIPTIASAAARRGASPGDSVSPRASGRWGFSRGSAARSGSSPTWTCC